jgi:hypothetical protein
MKQLLLILCLFPLFAYAQIGEIQIEADFNSMPFTEFVSKLEQKENLRFFLWKPGLIP